MPAIIGKQVNEPFRPKWWQILIAIALFGLVIWIGISVFQHKQNQRRLTEDLANSGLALDDLAEEFKKSDLGVEPKRDEYCYRASRKWEKGPIYCGQSVSFSKSNVTDEQLSDDYDQIGQALLSFTQFKFEKPYVSPNNPQYVEYRTKTSHPDGGCRARLADASTNQYELLVECLSGDFDKFIYPER